MKTYLKWFELSGLHCIWFSCTPESLSTSFFFNSCHLQLMKSVKIYLGHILHSNLSDDEDIVCVRKDLTRRANCMLHLFSCCTPCVKISSFCLFLYGFRLWSSSAPALRSLETTFNNNLHKIWHLPRMCHTGILHQVAHLDSIFTDVQTFCCLFAATSSWTNYYTILVL